MFQIAEQLKHSVPWCQQWYSAKKIWWLASDVVARSSGGDLQKSICPGMLLQDNHWPVQRSSFAPILCTLHSLGSNFDFCSSGSYVYTRLRCWWWPRQRQDSWKLFIDFNFSSSVGTRNKHNPNCKKWAKKVGAELVLHAFANLKGENRSAGAEQYTVGQIYNICRSGGGEYMDGEKNDMFQPDADYIWVALFCSFHSISLRDILAAEKLKAIITQPQSKQKY